MKANPFFEEYPKQFSLIDNADHVVSVVEVFGFEQFEVKRLSNVFRGIFVHNKKLDFCNNRWVSQVQDQIPWECTYYEWYLENGWWGAGPGTTQGCKDQS